MTMQEGRAARNDGLGTSSAASAAAANPLMKSRRLGRGPGFSLEDTVIV
jgi:hypothetical protein